MAKFQLMNIANYNYIKRNNINNEKNSEIILECDNEENKNYIKINNFDNLKLLTLE